MIVTAVYRFRNSERLLLNTVGKWSLLAGLRPTPAFWDGPDELQGNLLHMAAVLVRLTGQFFCISKINILYIIKLFCSRNIRMLHNLKLALYTCNNNSLLLLSLSLLILPCGKGAHVGVGRNRRGVRVN